MKAVPDTACFVACLLIALALRLAVVLHEPGQLAIDRDAYLGIAENLVNGRGFSIPNSSIPTAYRPPLYPLSLALGYWLVPQLPVVAEINLLAGLMTVWLTVSLGMHLNLGRARYLAALFVGVDPLLLQYTARPMTESLCTFLTALWLWTVVAGSPSRFLRGNSSNHRLLHGILVGVTFGLLVLCRPTFWPIAGLFMLWLLFRLWRKDQCDGASERIGLIGFATGSVIGTVTTVLPWLARNWLVFGVPILTTTHGGYTLLLGNNQVFYDEVISKPWGTVWSDPSQREWELERRSQAEQELGSDFSEISEDSWNSRRAKQFIISHPGPTAEAVIHRIRSLWNTSPQGDAADGVNRWVLIAVGCYYSVALALSFIGMILVLRRGAISNWLPLFVLIVAVQAVHLLYWTNTRMRAPLTPALGLFAAAIVAKRTRTVPDDFESPQDT